MPMQVGRTGRNYGAVDCQSSIQKGATKLTYFFAAYTMIQRVAWGSCHIFTAFLRMQRQALDSHSKQRGTLNKRGPRLMCSRAQDRSRLPLHPFSRRGDTSILRHPRVLSTSLKVKARHLEMLSK